MATRSYSVIRKGIAALCEWETLASGDDGAWIPVWEFRDRTVQLTGNFSGASVVWEGSLDTAESKTAFTLRDSLNNSLSISGANMSVVLENTLYLRPRVIGGNGSTAILAKLSGL